MKGRGVQAPALSLRRGITAAEIEHEFACPNPNWTEEVTEITITSFKYSVTFAGFTEPAILITGNDPW
jgi:hypothetical protein